jgi:hypothetical protein
LILNDRKTEERKIGLALGIDMLLETTHVWVFGDNLTEGMREEIRTAVSLKRTIHYINDYQCYEILRKYGGILNEKEIEYVSAI